MKINIVCVGTLKEKYLHDAVIEYQKRISRFANCEIIEVKEERLPQNYSNSDIELVKEKESVRLKDKIEGYFVLLDINGTMLDSVKFSKKIEQIKQTNSTISFVIGGSYGVSENLKQDSDLRLSFSPMTFPHQLARVMLLEQIYRAFTISNNITYHK